MKLAPVRHGERGNLLPEQSLTLTSRLTLLPSSIAYRGPFSHTFLSDSGESLTFMSPCNATHAGTMRARYRHDSDTNHAMRDTCKTHARLYVLLTLFYNMHLVVVLRSSSWSFPTLCPTRIARQMASTVSAHDALSNMARDPRLNKLDRRGGTAGLPF